MRIRTALPVLLSAIVLLAAPAFAGSASAQTSGTPGPSGELVRLFDAYLGRTPDPAGLAQYEQFVDQDCVWGLQSAAFKIGNSDEAHARGRNNAAALYDALLDRSPDAGGAATYTAALRDRGLRWSTGAMMASSEYRTRLGRICAGHPSTTALMLTPDQAEAYADDVLYERAAAQLEVCGVLKGVQQVEKLRKSKQPWLLAAGVTGTITNQIVKVTGVDLGGCKAAVAFLKAGIEMDLLRTGSGGTRGPGGNPVFLQEQGGTRNYYVVQLSDFDIRIGGSPVEWKDFSARNIA